MDLEREVSGILAEAERKLASLAADALQRRDYAAVHRLSGVAERVAMALTFDEVVGRSLSGPAAQLHRTNGNGTGEIQPPKQTEGFPRFFRDSAQLVKIGYSKSERRSYEHRSSREVLDQLVSLLVDIGARGMRFTTDQILPPGEDRLCRFPTYQVYLCLAFLVRHGIVRRHGRSGYTISADCGADLGSAVGSAWSKLPTR